MPPSRHLTVGGAGSATLPTATISRESYTAWLRELSPGQLAAVVGDELVDRGVDSVPGEFREYALGMAHVAGRAASDARLAAQAVQPPPPLVEAHDGAVYYTSGGPAYRRVTSHAAAESMGLNLHAAFRVALEPHTVMAPWPAGSTVDSAFVETGRLVAAGGSIPQAYLLARFARPRVR